MAVRKPQRCPVARLGRRGGERSSAPQPPQRMPPGDPMTEPTTTAVPEHVEHRISTPDGRTLAVAEWGDPEGLPLLAIHGTPGGRISWFGPDPGIDARHG